jgi:catechol 2,3-dioxygenase-like lactoylglutathione lyase family enzyme
MELAHPSQQPLRCSSRRGRRTDRFRNSFENHTGNGGSAPFRDLVLSLMVTSALTLSTPGVSWAQLATPNHEGVAMGHVHYHVRDIEAHKTFWVALGARPVKFGTTDVMKFPELLIFLTKAEASGSTEGSVVSHVAFKVPDLSPVRDALARAGQKIVSPGMVHTPEGDAVELFNGNTENVKFIPDPGHGDVTAHRHSQRMTLPIATHHIHLYLPEGADDRARDWYVRMFGAVPGIRFRYKAADLPGMTMNFLGQPDAKAPTKGRTLDHIGFEIRGLEAFCRTLEGKGVKFDVPFKRQPNGMASAFLTDPWGTFIELTEGLNGL